MRVYLTRPPLAIIPHISPQPHSNHFGSKSWKLHSSPIYTPKNSLLFYFIFFVQKMNLISSVWSRTMKSKIYYTTLVTFLCVASYLLAVWQNSRPVIPRATTAEDAAAAAECDEFKKTLLSPDLDFTAHHTAEDPPPTAARDVTFPACGVKLSEYTPCEDQKRSLRFPRERLEYRERHCPERDEVLRCRIPAPYGYKTPFRWPESRDVAWFANVPHTELTVEKKNQNWVRYENDRFWFPGGGTMFPRGADAYIDDIGRLIDLSDGSIRTAIDTGCGVASFGAYLLSRKVMTMSFAPRDTHEAQVQFALERGVPAMIGIMATIRLPYPSRSFDLAHCSRCLIPWGQYDGIYLMEVDRVLRPGGYWILSGPPINWQNRWKGWGRTMDDLEAEQTQIERVARNLCWKKVVQKDNLAVWQKPFNHVRCRRTRDVSKKPQFCQKTDPDMAWYTKLETCLTPLPEVPETGDIEAVAGGKLEKWPARLNAIPPRISSGTVEGITAEMFLENTELWKNRVSHYKTLDHQLAERGRYRNLLDMNAYLGGFAAALVDDPVWVMNVVPVEASVNTLGVVYERGLIGTYQNWCEAMSTYPRTYDFVHADSVFSLYQDQCEPEEILLEMDRILRPGGGVMIRDDVDILVKVKRIIKGLQWEGRIFDHEKGPHEREKILYAVKQYWTAPSPNVANSSLS
ncbi:PREDICTED: probable methyltransferase PMT16 [Tarenaya hassleriana]|uniref:probable methyltransferase PMT16 n=1 Tax=Tarenaya hassleriana TaxID=28532 RepID=UPI00053C67D7|nr:PREDICTED: probable methyltransferase PMT16 [Tarenaya hassleriana]